jgi:hypothetical protein
MYNTTEPIRAQMEGKEFGGMAIFFTSPISNLSVSPPSVAVVANVVRKKE